MKKYYYLYYNWWWWWQDPALNASVKSCGNKKDTDELILFYSKNDVWAVKITSFFIVGVSEKMFSKNKSGNAKAINIFVKDTSITINSINKL